MNTEEAARAAARGRTGCPPHHRRGALLVVVSANVRPARPSGLSCRTAEWWRHSCVTWVPDVISELRNVFCRG